MQDNGTRCYSADLPQDRMEILRTLVFKSSIKECKRAEDLIKLTGSKAVHVLLVTSIIAKNEAKSEVCEEPWNRTNEVQIEIVISGSLKAKDVTEMLSDEDKTETTKPPTKN